MGHAHGKRLAPSPLLCALMCVLLVPRPANPALPPSSSGAQSEAGAASGRGASGSGLALPAAATPTADDDDDAGWSMPPIRIGGSFGYDIRSERGDGRKMVQRGLIATVNAGTETYIWEPWFARLGGSLGLSTSRSRNSGDQSSIGLDNAFQTMAVSGSAHLRILPQSRFPFEGHWSRHDNRISSDLLSTGGIL